VLTRSLPRGVPSLEGALHATTMENNAMLRGLRKHQVF
jgi:hypothetical protein